MDYWTGQDWALQHRDRQIEENIRMLAGQQWMIFSDLLNKWIDISEFLTDEERRWRQRPVINRLLFWYMLTHARMTENPPTVTFNPSTGDRMDAQLAEVMDTIFKTLWIDLDMLDKIDRLFSWVIPGGHGYLKSRVDANKGPLRTFQGPAEFEGQVVQNAPFNEQGQALLGPGPNGQPQPTGEPFQMPEGMLDVQVLSPLEVRGQWGPQPFHDKRWVIHRSFLTPEEVWDTWSLDVPSDTFGEDAEGSSELQRVLFGAGYFGAAANTPGIAGLDHGAREGLVTINEFWHIPTTGVPGMEQGRLLVATPNKVLFDGPRPAPFMSAAPIQYFDFVRLPGRPSGTSPQEMLNPIQRTYNRGVAQILEHRNLSTNPIAVVDETSGIEPEQLTNRPGLVFQVNRRSAVPALEYIQPPTLSDDVWRTQGMLQDEISFLGNLEGAEGTPPTRDASGELVKELRFNTDRFLGPTLRRAVLTMPRLVKDWMAWLPLIWDEEKIISYAGEDQVLRTVTVMPELFDQGNVNIAVDIESMLPEGRGERQNRIQRMYETGLFGIPGEPAAINRFYDLARFPHMTRAHRPGGIDAVTAEQENGRLVRGEPATSVAILEWYNHEIHLVTHEEFMKSPEYLRLEPRIQLEFMKHRQVHLAILQAQQAQALQAQLQQAMLAADLEARSKGRQEEGGGSPAKGGASGSSGNGGPPSRSALPAGIGAGNVPEGTTPRIAPNLFTAEGGQ
jgi:hypothetical protein